MEMKCLVVLLQISWVLAQGGGKEDDFGGFSLMQSDFPVDGAGASNETSNDTSTGPLSQPAGGDQPVLFKPGGDQAVLADQPQPEPEPVVPTRLPNPAGGGATTSPPPLVRPEGNSTANASTAAASSPAPTQGPKSKGEGDGSAAFMGNLALVLGGACVLHLLY